MKKIIKRIIKKLTKFFVKVAGTNKLGRYITEHLARNIFEQKRDIRHNNINLSFYSPNRLNKFRIDTFSTKEPETLSWIENFNERSVFWDIGANIGLYTCYAAKLKNSKVYAFEPSIFNLEILAKNIFTNKVSKNVSIISFPLFDALKETEFKMSMTDWGGSVSTFGENYKHDGSELKKEFNYNTVGMSMDECCDVLKMKQPDYIKIDVDGIEHLILKGGTETLKKTKSVLVEVDENFVLQVEKTSEYLKKAGMKLKKKLHSDLIDKSKFSSVFNQIWERN